MTKYQEGALAGQFAILVGRYTPLVGKMGGGAQPGH